MSNDSTALPRFASVLDATAITSPSTATLPDSKVSELIGTGFSFRGRPIRIFPADAATFGAAGLAGTEEGAAGATESSSGTESGIG